MSVLQRLRISPELLDEVISDVEGLDLSPLERTLCDVLHGKSWSPAQAQRAIERYRRFLILLIKYPDETLFPSDEVEEVWRTHILDTQKYAADCERIFGTYLHHDPYLALDAAGDEEFEARFTRTQELYQLEFGEPMDPFAIEFG